MPQRATSTSFKKGQVANPNGRPRLEVVEYAKTRLAELTPAALDHLQRMLGATIVDDDGNDTPDDAMRERGMLICLERVLGKAVERKELSGADGGKIQIEDSTPTIRLLLQQALASEAKVIEAKDITDE